MSANTPMQALQLLKAGNQIYVNADSNPAKHFMKIRKETAQNGQNPYAVILTCSDSRVPTEHVFSAGIGDLFVIRTAGNVVGEFELGSAEYGCRNLGAKILVVLGHTHCGAIAATINGTADGFIQKITDEIKSGLNRADTEETATNHNIKHSMEKLLESPIIKSLVDQSNLFVVSAKYDIETGVVTFFEVP